MRLAAICLTVFLTVSSVAWSIAAAFILAPPVSAPEVCARNETARASAFCIELARGARQ